MPLSRLARNLASLGATVDFLAAIIATALFAAMLPVFLGLVVVLPVLGHATWHL